MYISWLTCADHGPLTSCYTTCICENNVSLGWKRTEHETLPAICGNILVESLQTMKHYLLYAGISWLKAYGTWNITCYMWVYLLVESWQYTKHYLLFVGLSLGWNRIELKPLATICGNISWLKVDRALSISYYMWEYLFVESVQNTDH